MRSPNRHLEEIRYPGLTAILSMPTVMPCSSNSRGKRLNPAARAAAYERFERACRRRERHAEIAAAGAAGFVHHADGLAARSAQLPVRGAVNSEMAAVVE